ncbi:RNA polymerase factor sigma-54 [Emticicia oligotrophica]|uniref:RNA polymerase factor sigma-54 n=1 Tax=Emticicia oligotrophica TaxID=312279 RepID=UPI00273B54F4|nr:RNA polymerase factor sigma-54 [Emticicia oligotrophica]
MLNLVQSHKQTLKISPTQIQLLNFFQLNALELEQYIKNELEENPVLEEGSQADEYLEDNLLNNTEDRTQDYMDWDEFSDDNIPDYRTRVSNYSEDESFLIPILTESVSWRDEVKEQFYLFIETDRQRFLADYIVDSLTDEGYLLVELDALTDDVSFSSGTFVDESEVAYLVDILRKIQPLGLGTKGLQECLLVQLERNTHPIAAIAQIIVKEYFEELATHNYDKLKKVCAFSSDEIKEAVALIASLNPQPVVGGQVNSSLMVKDNVIPDYIVIVEGESIDVSLNSRGIPALSINKSYTDSLVGGSKEVNSYLNAKINAANWLIEAIQQRENTMLKTIKAIVKIQRDFFSTGNIRLLKPMILQDIAEQIKMDISTVSRVTSGKYAQTPFGIIHLKDIFTEGVKTHDGEEVSNRQIQLVLEELILNEDKNKPFNDFQLTELLSKRGYQIARRTVAKYREILGILPANLRRVL